MPPKPKGKKKQFFKPKAKPAAKAKFNKKKQPIPLNVFGMGAGKVVKMQYEAHPFLNTGDTPTQNVLTGQLSFRLNNINLPFIGQIAGNILPQGYTQAALAFSRFKVMGVKIEAEFFDPSDDCMLAMMVASSAQAFDLQNANVTNADVQRNIYVKSISSTGSRRIVFKKYVPIHGIEGLTHNQFNGDISMYSFPFQNSIATALTDEAGTTGDLMRKRVPKVHFAIASNETQTAAISVKARIKLTYYTNVYGRVTLANSSSIA